MDEREGSANGVARWVREDAARNGTVGGRGLPTSCNEWRSIPSLGQARAFTPRCSPGDTEPRVVARLSQAGYWPGVAGTRGRQGVAGVREDARGRRGLARDTPFGWVQRTLWLSVRNRGTGFLPQPRAPTTSCNRRRSSRDDAHLFAVNTPR